jgi:hypothetical protein
MLLQQVSITNTFDARNTVVRVRCPGCRDRTALEPIGGVHDVLVRLHSAVPSLQAEDYLLGQRLCANPDCRSHVFIVMRPEGNDRWVSEAVYPPETINFDTTNLPSEVLAAFEEAVSCHAQNCQTAAAMMVRKTLEEVCRDRGAEGRTLQKRIEALSSRVVLPQVLLEGLDALRLLGNDAAHVESRDYEQVGSEEVEVAIDVTKEILKATYQFDSIVGRLTALQRRRDEASE